MVVLSKSSSGSKNAELHEGLVYVRRIHRRDLNRVWEFLKKVFRDVNRETVEYQRPRSKGRFLEIYEEEGVAQLLFEVRKGVKQEIVGYTECAFAITGSDNWMNKRYFDKHDMRPLFVEELAVHPDYQGQGLGAFILEQLEHLARLRGCTHLVLAVAENNSKALGFYRKRNFYKLDAALFMAKKVTVDSELLPPRPLKRHDDDELLAEPKPKPSAKTNASSSKMKAESKASKAISPTKSTPRSRSKVVARQKSAAISKSAQHFREPMKEPAALTIEPTASSEAVSGEMDQEPSKSIE